MFTRKKITLAILSACLAPSYAFATDLEPVEVTATAEAPQQATTDAKTLLQAGNSETGTTLRQIPGVDAARMGGHGVDLVIRGQKETQLNILIDGAKIEGGCPNRMDPPTAYAEMSSFDEVTVIKGINSVTYAAGGSGGTVLFERHAPTFEDGKPYNVEINAGTTSNGLKQDINATVSAGGDKGYIIIQGAKKSAENYKDGNGDEVRSSYESQQGHIDLGWTPNEDHELRLSYENTLTEDALFQGASMDAPLSDGTTTRLLYTGANVADNIQNIDVNIYNSVVDHQMDNYTLRTPNIDPTKRMTNTTNVESTGAKVQLSSMFGHTKLDYGVQYESINSHSQLSNSGGTDLWMMWPDVTTETKSIFVESTSSFKDRQEVILGLRYDNFNADAAKADVSGHSNGTSNIPTANAYTTYVDYSGATDTEFNNVNALVRYERKLQNGINLYTGLSLTHRNPNATELYIAKGGQWVGNPDLNPEQHKQLDLGFSQQGKSSKWSVSAYYDQIDDYILRDLASLQDAATGGGTIYVNKDARIMGLEATSDFAINKNTDIGGSVNLTKGFNDTDDRNLTGISPLAGNLYVNYTESNWDAGARVNFATEQSMVNSQFGEPETPAWNTVDLYGNYQINKTIKLSAGIDNVFDHAYYTYENRVDPTTSSIYKLNEPGRIIWAKLNAKF